MGALSGIRRSASTSHLNRPFITDIAANRRTEFTGALFEQWVAKTSNWLEAEFGTELQLHVELPTHWLWPVFVAAIDELEGTLVPRDRADLVVRFDVEPDAEIPVLAINDHPMALPFNTAMPADQYDFFLEVRSGADRRSWGPTHTLPLIDDGARLWFADDLGRALEAPDARIGVIGSAVPLHTVDAIAACSLLAWRCNGSLVMTRDPDALANERVTHIVDLRD